MGYDLVGLHPTSEQGEYFRNSVWWWPRLWKFVCAVADDLLSEEDKARGLFNDGYEIGKQKAKQLGQRLEKVLALKERYKAQVTQSARINHPVAEKVRAILEEIADEVKPEKKSIYPFSWENVREFAEFCKASGGFRIC